MVGDEGLERCRSLVAIVFLMKFLVFARADNLGDRYINQTYIGLYLEIK